MNLFWIGIIVFAIGVIIRIIFKFRLYREYNRAKGMTEIRKKEINTRYRPLIFIGLGIETAGVVLGIIYLCMS